MILRPATHNDIPELRELYRHTILTVNARDYSPEQVAAWAATADRTESLYNRIGKQYFIVAVAADGRIAGFGSIETPDYLDLMYVHKDFQRQGVGRLLMEDMIRYARENGFTQIESDVSVTAKPLFEAFGFEWVADQWPITNGVTMPNFKLRLLLS